MQLHAALGRDLAPMYATVFAAVNPFERACDPDFGIGRGLGQGADGLPLHGFDRSEGLAGIVADEQGAVRVIEYESPDQHGLGVGLIDHDVVEDEVVALGKLDQRLPARPTIFRLIDPAIGSAEVKMLIVGGIGGEAARVPSVRPYRNPGSRLRQGGLNGGKSKQQEARGESTPDD